ncbi:hypothetical protein BCR36DRAFT_401950 [Piromyces finnis]|uniref:Uncharacterized protein n=1 Tax=Piromyces finnis TaxID=1754191 RepID=A0A1Y1VK55_9FUNG|nr:hypothetical protein BCR36DRAFT_401950 [Piromyces finnis]|eukprot:ORX58425.1 hypothetical protein BCR36DRAFT_401950 [Piromyces finnis]
MSSINKEDDIVNLIKNRGMKTSEYLNKNDSFHENKIDSSIYEKFKLNQYRYASSSDIHKSLNLNSDDEAMCTRLVKLTNYHLNNLEPYKSKKDKMDTYVIVKNLLKDVDKQYKKEQEDLKNKPKWVIKKPEDKRETFLIEKNETTNTNTKAKEFDNYYDFIDVNDITRVEDVNRLTELTIASYDYFKKTNDVFKKKVKVNHNTPNLRLYNKHYGQPVDFKKMNKKNNVEEAYNKKKKAFGNEYTRKMIEAEKEHEKEQLENKRRHFSKLYNTMPLQHPVMSISDKAIVQYNKRKKFNDDDIKRLLNYKTIKNRNFNQDLYSENHINTINEIIEKKGNKKDLLLYSYSNLFSDKNKILDEIDTNLYDKNGNYKNILSNNIDPYKKYCSLDPIIEFEINKALSNKSMKENNFFWFKSDKKPIENIDIMNEMISNSFIPDLMRNSKIQKPPYNTNDNLPNISKNSQSQ